MRILVTSDNHLGYNENDFIRGDDSYRTFDEILSIAHKKDVDFILQGGDLFHDHKPSRNAYNRTIQILKKYVTAIKKEINFDGLSFVNRPILSIHGNHDDPSGLNLVSPMDVLHSTELVHYFGKIKNMNDIVVEPILIEKGDIKVAVYGIGYIKDSRMYKMLQENKIKFKRVDGYFSILMVHQNRVPRNNGYFPENKIPEWMDVAIYGHEHKSIKTRTENFEVIQVGSSVRTSLSLDEAGDKYVYIIEINKEGSKISRELLRSVRAFKIETLKGDVDINKYINNMTIEKINDLLPLLRLRIEDYSCNINKVEIEKIVENKIANPSDCIRFIKRSQSKKLDENEDEKGQFVHQKVDFNNILRNKLNDSVLNVMTADSLIDALELFIKKGGKDAFTEAFHSENYKIMKMINFDDLGAEDVNEVIERAKNAVYEELKRNKIL